MVTSRVLYRCEVCSHEFDTKERAEACEAQVIPEPVRLPIGTWVKLDARGQKCGPKFVRARVTGYVISSRHVIDVAYHEWHVQLDRHVHLVETWGEGGTEYSHQEVDVRFILPDDLSQADPSIWGTLPDTVWEDLSDHSSCQYPYEMMRFPEDRPEAWPVDPKKT